MTEKRHNQLISRLKEAIKIIEEGNSKEIFNDVSLLIDRLCGELRYLYGEELK